MNNVVYGYVWLFANLQTYKCRNQFYFTNQQMTVASLIDCNSHIVIDDCIMNEQCQWEWQNGDAVSMYDYNINYK